jgi:hypothetical protein
MRVLAELNDTNGTCPYSLLWDQSTIDSQRPALYVCIVASIAHSIFWSQLIFLPAVRNKSMQWLYAYLATDILLLFRFFFLFIVHITSNECIPNFAWSLFICYFEAIFDNYLNALEVYILLALNICRYFQIVHNRNVYRIYVRSLICAHLIIYLAPLIGFIIELSMGSAIIRDFNGGSCDIAFKTRYIQIFNIICEFILPILLNIIVIYCNVRHIHSISRLRRAQHYVSAREKYHRSLVIQFIVFYTVWLLLWSPNLIVYQFTNGISTIIKIASLLNFIEITLDPIIISALDVRFQQLWRNLWTRVKDTILCNQRNQIRVAPITRHPNALLRLHVHKQIVANIT